MATVTNVRLVDDLDGSEADTTVELALDGKAYEIDLSERHAAELRDALAPYVQAARRAGAGPAARRPRAAASTPRRADQSAVREWAVQNGFEVSARGRMSSAVLEAYRNRDSAAPAEAPKAEEPAVEDAPAKPKRRSRKVADPFAKQAAS